MRTKASELKGKKFGRLTYLGEHIFKKESSGKEGFKNRMYGLFQCECGTEKYIQFKSVKSGRTQSCGCLIKEFNPREWTKATQPEETSWRYIWKRHKSNSKIRGIEHLDFFEFIRVSQLDCFYCGSSPERYSIFDEPKKRALWKGPEEELKNYTIYLNGIDRYQNIKTYVGNSVPCCKVCNVMKGQMSPEEFQERCATVANKNLSQVSLNKNYYEPIPESYTLKRKVYKKVVELNQEGFIVKKWSSVGEAATHYSKTFNLTHGNMAGIIRRCCHQDFGSYRGIFFRYEENLKPAKTPNSYMIEIKEKRKVVELNREGTVLREWPSVRAAANHYVKIFDRTVRTVEHGIRGSCRIKNGSYKGLIFRYLDNLEEQQVVSNKLNTSQLTLNLNQMF